MSLAKAKSTKLPTEAAVSTERAAELDVIVSKMRTQPGGIDISDRKSKGKQLPKCFAASEAVNWMVKNLSLKADTAVALGVELEDNMVWHHTSYKEKFANNKELLFRFNADEKSDVLNSQKTWLADARPAVSVSRSLLTAIVELCHRYFGNQAVFEKAKVLKLQADPDYKDFVISTAELQKVEVAKLTHEEKLCFFINTHNCLVLHGFVECKKIPSKARHWITFSETTMYNIGGFPLSLMEIQHGVLRHSMQLPDIAFAGLVFNKAKIKEIDPRFAYVLTKPEPLLPFALYHNTASTPVLKLYNVIGLYSEMLNNTKSYLKRDVTISTDGDKVQISLPYFFSWYGRDYGISKATTEKTIKALKSYLPDDLRVQLYKLDLNKASIKYTEYNWVPTFSIPESEFNRVTVHRKVSVLIKRRDNFDAPIEMLMTTTFKDMDIPPFIKEAVADIKARGLDTPSLFVKQTDKTDSEVNEMEYKINLGDQIDFTKYQPNSITQMLKLWFQNMTEPIISWKLSKPLIDAMVTPGIQAEKIHQAQTVLEALADGPRKKLILFFLDFLRTVVERAHKNDSDARTLGIVFGPVWIKVENASAKDVLENAQHSNAAMQLLIEAGDKIFA